MTPCPDPYTASTIGKQSTFEGNLTVAGRLTVSGTITGDINAQGDVVISGGFVKGNITARSIMLCDNANVVGNLVAVNQKNAGLVTFRSSKLEGNISCVDLDIGATCEIKRNVETSHSAVVDGKVTGDSLSSDGSVKILTHASIESSIIAPKIAVDDGATLNGKITMGIKAK